MPWCFSWPDSLKKRTCRYLLQHYLGQYLQEKLSLDQLSVNLYSGKGTIRDICLDVAALNEIGESHNLPIEVVDGYISSISVTIPWSSLLSDNSIVEIHGLMMTVQPKQRSQDASMFDSTWGSMTTSMQLAEECLRQGSLESEKGLEPSQPLEGVELFAQTIETVLCRIKVRFIDTTIRLEYIPNSSKSGVALEIRIKKIDYYDEAGNDSQEFDDGKSKRNLYEPAAFSTKRFTMEGVTLYTDEFPHQYRTLSRSAPLSPEGKFSEATQIAPGSPEMPPPHSSLYCNQNTYDSTEDVPQDPIPFAVLTGHEELRLKLKHNESIVGAKVDIEFNIGPVVIFLSPRQIKILLEVAKGLSRPDLEGSERILKNNYKPMGAADYALVEQELQKQLNQPQILTRGLQHQQGWSSHSLDDSDEEFLPMTGKCSTKIENGHNSITDLESSGSSVGSSISRPSGFSYQGSNGSYRRSSFKSKGNVHEFLQDPLTELTQFSARFSSLWMIILHDDILAPSAMTNSSRIALPSLQTVNKMKEMAENFFQDVTEIMLTGINFKDFAVVRKQLSGICEINHMRIIATPITVEGNEKSSLSQWLLSMSVTIVDAEVIECLYDSKLEGKKQSNVEPECCEVLSFSHKLIRSTGSNVPSWNDPCLRIKYHQMQKTSQVRSLKQPNNSIVIQLGPIYSELDVSILDRIHVLLNAQPSPSVPEKQQDSRSNLHCWQSETEHQMTTAGKTDIMVNSPFVLLCFRFPVPDLRPLHDMDRVPWWQRNLRKETLLMELTDASLNSTMDSSEVAWKWEIQCRDAHGLFQEIPNETPISFLRACVDPNADGHAKDEGFDWPRLVLKANPVNQHSILETEILPNNESSHMNSFICQVDCPDMSPFAARKVFYEMNTPESIDGDEKQQNGSSCEADQVIMPADKYQIQDFIEKTMNNTRYTLEFTLPNINIFLPSKHFYEVLYNRLSTDLVMWELSAPKSNVHCDNFTNKVQCPVLDLTSQLVQNNCCFQTFSMCRSALQYDSSSDSEEDNGVYYSIHEHWQRQKRKHHKTQTQTQSLQSHVSILINITQGKASLIAPLRDSSSNVVPGQYGELQLHMEDSSFFFVSKYHGESNNSFICMQANKATFYHNGMLSTPAEKKVGPANLIPPSHLKSTIYLSDVGIPQKRGIVIGKGSDSMDMLSIVIKVGIDEHDIKTFKVAVGISGATLRHYTTTTQQSWLTQFIDFFDIIDYPVAGYTPPSIMTELHLDLSSCAIDYRPLHLPLRTVVMMDNFSVSSNIAANTTTSVLRIIAEGVCLFISDKIERDSVDLRNDYVCVVDTDLFDLSLRMTDGKDPAHPKLDLKANNNMVNVRTCADSCRALQNLITYFASDGDLLPGGTATKGAEVPILIAENGECTLTMSKSEVDHVHNLMAEAMKESQNGCYSSCLDDNYNEDSDFDEENFSKHSPLNGFSASPNLSHENTLTLQTEIDDYTDAIESDDDMDDPSVDEEFCILEDDPGTGFTPKSGEPQVRLLTSEPLRLVENHFSVPVGRTDELKAPKTFPPAVWRYVLRQISIKFHFYGGNDFDHHQKKSAPKGKEKHVTLKDERKEKHGHSENNSPVQGIYFGTTLHLEPQNIPVGFTNIGGQESLWTNISPFTSKTSPKNNKSENWLTKGGKGRQLDVLMELQLNKLRFQHEVYPEKGEYASRQVLLIHDVEIRDRLASSQINKFLYQYASKTMPRQSHANMVVIKALHTRPDPNLPIQECSVRVSIKPLRLNIDQDALLFLYNFFVEVCDISSNKETMEHNSAFSTNTPHHSPVMGITSHLSSGLTPTEPDRTLILLQERTEETQDLIGPLQENTESGKKQHIHTSGSFASPIYFRSFDFSPDVPIRLDYNGKRVDMDQGALAGLLMGLGQLNCCELRLKKLSFRHGLLGVEKLLSYALKQWLKDIKRNQLPGIIAGLGPMYSLTQLFQGIIDLFYLPYEQFQKGGHITRGIKRGADSFYTSTAMAFLELANRLVQAIQGAAEITYDMVSPGPSVKMKSHGAYLKVHSSSHPADIREGVSTAIQVVREGLGDTARTIVRVASEEHEHKGMSGALGAVVRQIPPTVVKPIIIMTEATSNILGGVRNHLAPDVRQEAIEKWRSEQDH